MCCRQISAAALAIKNIIKAVKAVRDDMRQKLCRFIFFFFFFFFFFPPFFSLSE